MKKEYQKFGNSFCILPFLHTMIDLDNQRKLCCESAKFTINENRLNKVRQLMLENKPVKECEFCQNLENRKIISQRQKHNAEWQKKIPNEIEDIIINPKTIYYDLRYSNLCNLTCKMCGPRASSAWAKILQKENVYKTWDPETFEINTDVRKIYMAGGEPFLIKSFSSVLDKVKNTDCEIVINTNATIITNHMLESLKKFKNVCFTLSIDGTGQTIEKIRKGSNWNEIQKNISILKKELNPSFMVSTTLQVDNILNIPELAKWIDNQDIRLWNIFLVQGCPDLHPYNFNGNINWQDDLWTRNCVKNNQALQQTLRNVMSVLSS